MKIKVVAQELLDSNIEFVSLVKNGAIRSPFKILKQEQEMERQRRRRKQDILAKRHEAIISGSSYQRARAAAQRAADVGCAFLKNAPISGDTDEMDPQPGRYGSDSLQANTSAERGVAENDAATLARLREIISMLRSRGMDRTASALESFYSLLESGTPLNKSEAEAFERTLFGVRSAFNGGSLDWLEAEGEAMRNRNADLVNDRSLSSLDESISASPRDVGIRKADRNDVLDDAYDSGMGVSGNCR